MYNREDQLSLAPRALHPRFLIAAIVIRGIEAPWTGMLGLLRCLMSHCRAPCFAACYIEGWVQE